MGKSFTATLITDVWYRDFDGKIHTQPAGTHVIISQRGEGIMSIDMEGNVKEEEPGSFIASIGDLHFDVERDNFQINQ
jgi:hypothetical protein